MQIETKNWDEFDALATMFRKKLAEIINDTLQLSALTQEQRKELCSEIMAEFTAELDFGHLQLDDECFRPTIGFISGENIKTINEKTKCLMPYPAYQHHEHVWYDMEELEWEPKTKT